MLRLNERQRAFVWHLFDLGVKNKATEAARRAGYSQKSYNGLKVTAHGLMHNPLVQAAIHEVSIKHLGALKPIAIAGFEKILRDPDHPKHYEAINSLLDRGGLGAKTEHKVTVEHKDDDSTVLKKIQQYCDFLGLDQEARKKLLGSQIIDVEATEVAPDQA